MGLNKTVLAAIIGSMGNASLVFPLTFIPLGDSITSHSADGNWIDAAVLASNGRLVQVRNAGIQGNTTQQVIDRFATDVAAYASTEIWIQTGTNDAALTVDQYKVKLNSLLDLAIATGRKVRLFKMPPRNTSTALIASFRDAVAEVGAARSVQVHDLWLDSVDTGTGGFLAGRSDDGIHPSNVQLVSSSAQLVAALGVPTTSNISLPTVNSAGGGMLSNPLFVTDTNADGIADLWAMAGSATSKAASLVASTYGNKQRLAVTNDTGDAYIAISPNLVTVAGRKYRFVGKLNVAMAGGLWSMAVRWLTSASVLVSTDYPFYGKMSASGEFSIELVAPATGVRLSPRFTMSKHSAYSTYSGTIDIEQFQIYDLGVA